MSTITLKVFMENGYVSKKVQFEAKCQIYEVYKIIEEKVLNGAAGENYGLFLPSAINVNIGIWLEAEKTLEYYLLRDGDSIHYLNRMRNLKLRLLDGSVKTLKVDDSQLVSILLVQICTRIGITNHDEYALCRDEPDIQPTEDDRMSLKRKPQASGQATLERNAKMEMLKKKLKTDDDVKWVDPKKTLREQDIAPTEILLLKRRLFYSDRNIDSRDPVQLGLLYVQARDAILDGTHPVTEEKAVEFASIQCQIQFGDYDETKHTTELIDSTLKDFISEHYIKVRNIKKKILKEHQKHQGLPELEAKLLYIRTARSLTTYGVTFFLVKEKQKGKNKLVLRLLGINAESVLRVDENTREILEIWPLSRVKRWAPTTTTFTLDFGEYNKNIYVVQTTEALRIIEVLTGYIDLILKKRKEKDHHGLITYDAGQMFEEETHSSRANTIMNVNGGSNKVQQEFYVGPSHIIFNDNEQMAATETMKITTCHQITTDVSKQNNNKRMRFGSSTSDDVQRRNHGLIRRIINRISAASQGIIIMATGERELSIEALQEEMKVLKDCAPQLKIALEETTYLMDDKAKKIYMSHYNNIHDGAQQLTLLLNEKEPYNLGEIHSTATNVFDASTKLYFLLDPATNRRSQLLLASRKSFQLEDAETDKRLSQVMFSIIDDINRNVSAAEKELGIDDGKPILNVEHLHELKCKAAFKLARCNASAAVILAAHADPKNIDYSAAVTSFNTLTLMVSGVISDVKLLSKALPEEERKHVLNNIHEFCDATRQLCNSPKYNDPLKMNESTKNFAKHSGKLLYSVSPNNNPELENEIIALAKLIAGETSELLLTTKKAVDIATPERASIIETAGANTYNNADRLLTCAQLTAATIHEPHCQSAMMSSTDNTASSIATLTEAWKPALEDEQHEGLVKELMNKTLEVGEALDALKNACTKNLPLNTQFTPRHTQKPQPMDMEIDEEELMKDILSSTSNDAVKTLTWDDVIKDAMPEPTAAETEAIKNDMKTRISICNSGAANLLIAHTDPNQVDCVAAFESIDNLVNNVPIITREIHRLPINADNKLKSLLASTKDMCLADTKQLNEAVLKFGDDTSKVLHFVCGCDDVQNEELVMKKAAEIEKKVTNFNTHVNEVQDQIQDDQVKRKITKAVQNSIEATKIFSTCAKVISPTVHSTSCQESLHKATENIGKAVANIIKMLPENSCSAELSDINILLNDLQSTNAKIAANHLLVCHENISSKHTPKRVSYSYLGKYANKLVDAVHQLEKKEQCLKENPKDPIIQDDLKDAINKLHELLKLVRNNEKDSVKIIVKHVEPFKIKTEAMHNENNPEAVCGHARDLLNELQGISKEQKSPEARIRLAQLSQKIANAAKDLEQAQRKQIQSPDDDQLQKYVKQALENVQMIANDLKNSFDTEKHLSEEDKLPIKDIKASIDLNQVVSPLKPRSSDIIIGDKIEIYDTPFNNSYKEIKLLSKTGNDANKPFGGIAVFDPRKIGEPEQQKLQTSTKNTIDAGDNSNHQSLTNEVLDVIDEFDKIVQPGINVTNDYKVEVDNNSGANSVMSVSPNSAQLLALSFENIKQENKPDALMKTVELLIKDLNKIKQGESPLVQKKLDALARNLAEAVRALELAEKKAKHKPYDVEVQKELRKAIANIHNIVKEEKYVPNKCEDVLQMDFLAENSLKSYHVSEKEIMIDESLNLINAEVHSHVPNTKETQVYLQIDQKLLTDIQDKVLAEQEPLASVELVIKLADEIKAQEKHQNTPEAKRLLLTYAQRLADAAKDLETAYKHANAKHNDKTLQDDFKTAIGNLQKIIKELFPEQIVEHIADSEELSAESCKALRMACENVLNDSEVASIKDRTRVLLNDLELQMRISVPNTNINKCLQSHIKQLGNAAHQLEVADRMYKRNKNDAKAKKDVDHACKKIRDCVTDLHKSLTTVNKKEPKQLYIEIELVNAQNLLSSLDEIMKNNDTKLFGDLTKNTVREIQVQADLQKTPEARDYLESYIHKFNKADKDIKESVRSKKGLIFQDKKRIESAVNSIKLIAKDLKGNIESVTRKYEAEEEHQKIIEKMKGMINYEQSPANILEINKEIIQYIDLIASSEKDLEKRKTLELYAQQLTENSKSLEKALVSSQNKIKDEKAKCDVDNLCKKIREMVTDLLQTLTTVNKKEPKQSCIEVKLVDAENLLSSLDKIMKNNDTKLFGGLTKNVVKELQNQVNTQNSSEARDYLKSYIDKLNKAVNEIEESIKLKDKTKIEKSINSMKLIAKELRSNIKNDPKTFDIPEEEYLQITATMKLMMDHEQSTANILDLNKEIIKNINMLANKEKDLEKRKNLELYAQQLTESSKALEKAKVYYQNNPKNVKAKHDVDESSKKIREIVTDLLKTLTVNKKQPKQSCVEVKLVNAENLLSSLDEIMKCNEPKLFGGLINTTLKEIQNQVNTQNSSEARDYLKSYIYKLNKAVNEIEESIKLKDKTKIEKSINSMKLIAKELRSNIKNDPKTFDIPEEEYLQITATMKLMMDHEQSTANILDLNKEIIKNINMLANKEKDLEKRKNLELYAQQLTESSKALEKAKVYYQNNPKNVKAKHDVDESSKKLREIVTDLLKTLTVNKKQPKQSCVEVKLVNAENLLSSLDEIMKCNEPKLFGGLINTTLKEIQKQAYFQKSPEAGKYFESYIQKFNKTVKEIEDGVKLNDKKNTEKAIDSMKLIAKELRSSIEVDSTSFNLREEEYLQITATMKRMMDYEQSSANILDLNKEIIKNIDMLANKEKDSEKRKNLELYAQQLTDSSKALEKAKVYYQDNPKDVKAKQDVDELSKKIRELVTDLLKTPTTVIKKEPEHLCAEVKLVNGENLLLSLDEIIKCDEPKLFGGLTNTTLKEIQNQVDFQKSLEARDYFKSYIHKFNKTVKEFEDGVKLHDKNKTEKAINSIKLVAKELRSCIEDDLTSFDTGEKEYLRITATMKRMMDHEQSSENILDLNKEIIKNINMLANKEKDLEKRKNLELYAQQLTESSKALEKAKVYYQNNPKDVKAKRDLDELSKKICEMVTDLLKTLTTNKNKKQPKQSCIEVELVNAQKILSVLNEIAKNNETKLFGELTKNIVKEIEKQSASQKCPEACDYLKSYIKKFDTALRNIEEYDKLKDKKNTVKAIESMKMIATELKSNIEDVSKQIDITDGLDAMKQIIINEQLSTNKFIKEVIDKISLMAGEEKDIEKRKNVELYVQQLQDAAKTLENAQMHYQNNPQDKLAKVNQFEASKILMKIISDIQSMVLEKSVTPSENEVTEISITLHNAQELIENVDKVVNNKTNDLSTIVNVILKDIKHQATLQTSTPAKEYLDQYANEVTKALQDLEDTEKHIKGNVQDLSTNEQLNTKQKIIYKIIERFQSEIILTLKKETGETTDTVNENCKELTNTKTEKENTPVESEVTEITITLRNAQDLIKNIDKIVNNDAIDLHGVTNIVVKYIKHQATLQISKPAKEYLVQYADEISNALQDLISIEQTDKGKIQNPETRQQVKTKVNIIYKIIERFQKEIILTLNNAIVEKTIEQVDNTEITQEQESPNNYLDAQINVAKLWLLKPKMVKNKKLCQDAVTNFIGVAENVSDDLSKEDKNEIMSVIVIIKKLFFACCEASDEEKCRNLLDKILELKRLIERMVVNRVIDNFIEDEEPLDDIKFIVLYDTNTEKSGALLEEKITALLNQLSKVTSTARAVVSTRAVGPQLMENTQKAELLAPKLVKAAKLTMTSQPNKDAENNFMRTYKEYNDSVDVVRDMCDQAVDPLDFVRTAGERMHKLCEGQKNVKDAQTATRTNIHITKLAKRVLLVGASESKKTLDPEIESALQSAQDKLQAAILPTDAEIRISKLPEWTVTTQQILRVAGEVESALGGETIFTTAPEPDQPIYMAAHALHSCVSEWSATDNDIVEAARKVAVLMAKLNKHMMEDKKQSSIRASKQIVEASCEVARLARILANECTDVRIKNNLVQVCQQIPTISGQLKMLAAVKANTSTNTNSVEDKEAMVMLVDNAQNLMQSVQEVVKAAAAASVKIQSDRGFARMRWVRARRY